MDENAQQVDNEIAKKKKVRLKGRQKELGETSNSLKVP